MKKKFVILIVCLLLGTMFIAGGFFGRMSGAFKFSDLLTSRKISTDSSLSTINAPADTIPAIENVPGEDIIIDLPDCGDGVCEGIETPKGCPQDCSLNMADCIVRWRIPELPQPEAEGAPMILPTGDDVCEQIQSDERYCVVALSTFSSGVRMFSCTSSIIQGNEDITVLCCSKK